MKFHVVEKLPTLVQDGAVNKVYTEFITETKRKAKETTIKGELIITRELKVTNSRSEITIKDRLPVDITVPNNKKIIEEAEVFLNIQSFNLEFGTEFTEFKADIELTNVEEKAEQLA
jgi:hypothetical protein